jgi:hypothetical protein
MRVRGLQVFYHGNQRKWKGGSEPVDIFMHSRRGPNKIHLAFHDDSAFILVLQIISVVPVDQVYRVSRPPHPRKAWAMVSTAADVPLPLHAPYPGRLDARRRVGLRLPVCQDLTCVSI